MLWWWANARACEACAKTEQISASENCVFEVILWLISSDKRLSEGWSVIIARVLVCGSK
jgi:hypothetical protein